MVAASALALGTRFVEIGAMPGELLGGRLGLRVARFLAMSSVCLLVLDCAPKAMGESCEEHRSQCAKGLECDGRICRRCEDSSGCRDSGRCAFFADRCVVTAAGCEDSSGCKTARRCTAWEGQCVEKIPRADSGGNKEGGCPCGCDHSEVMVAELEDLPPVDALKEARRSLAVIEERERAGYITDAMVMHRLRLRELERTRRNVETVVERPRLEPPSRFPSAPRQIGHLEIRDELLVFGATVETVRGEPKALPACFRLRLGLENLSAEAMTLEPPRLTGRLGFDLRRWYVEGTDGEPWDGRLAPGERREVLVIGYIAEPVVPGSTVEVAVEFGDGVLRLTTSALARWDAQL